MHVWTLNLTLSGPSDLIRAHFLDLVDRYAEIEAADPRLRVATALNSAHELIQT